LEDSVTLWVPLLTYLKKIMALLLYFMKNGQSSV
jgi:hypothetical protein